MSHSDSFYNYKIDRELIKKLDSRGIVEPTPIQREVLPKILKGEDVIGQSKTGTGKTLAYLLPVITKLLRDKTNALIIAPTKELAKQIYEEASYYTGGMEISPVLLISGAGLQGQADNLKKDSSLVIGVPGRITKLMESGDLKPSKIRMVVLDEADFLIDLGFKSDIQHFFNVSKNVEQFLVFSATLSQKTKQMLNLGSTQKYAVRVDSTNTLPDTITNSFFHITDDVQRDKVLYGIMDRINPFLAIIFTRTKKESDKLFKTLKDKKYEVGVLNGDMIASQRKSTIKAFESAKLQYLVATDLASRGLDIDGITHVINYTLPLNELDYVHRAGRTGRMNNEGEVYSICNELDEGYLKKYAKFLDVKLTPVKFKGTDIIEDKGYKGVKPRLNLAELKKEDMLVKANKKKKEELENKKNRRDRIRGRKK